MFRLTGGACEDNVRQLQQPAQITTMEKLQNAILIPNRPERPNLVKHDNERTARPPFPLQHAIN